MTAARKRKIERMGRSVLANPEALHAALMRGKRPSTIDLLLAPRTSQEHIAALERCAVGSPSAVSAADMRAAARYIADLAECKPAIPPTLARLARTGIALHKASSAPLDEYLAVFSQHQKACAAHAAGKAKQRRGK